MDPDTETAALTAITPFLRWAGGKQKLLPQLLPYFPAQIGTYREPFFGGGSVFLALSHRCRHAYLSDANHHLINTWHILRQHPEALHAAVARLASEFLAADTDARQSMFTDASRHQPLHPSTPVDELIQHAANFILVNQTSFNGLYRVNRAGHFNNPMGYTRTPRIYSPQLLRRSHYAIRHADFHVADFRPLDVREGDVIYCDPPYDGGYTAYTARGFRDADQIDLQAYARFWASRGAQVILSNADTPLIRDIYAGPPFTIHAVRATHTLAGGPHHAVGDVIITTRDTPCST